MKVTKDEYISSRPTVRNRSCATLLKPKMGTCFTFFFLRLKHWQKPSRLLHPRLFNAIDMVNVNHEKSDAEVVIMSGEKSTDLCHDNLNYQKIPFQIMNNMNMYTVLHVYDQKTDAGQSFPKLQ